MHSLFASNKLQLVKFITTIVTLTVTIITVITAKLKPIINFITLLLSNPAYFD